MTEDGETIMVNGTLNRPRTLLNGFSHEICNHFMVGFPYYWDEFSALSFDEEPDHVSVATGFFGSDVYLTTPIGDERSSRDIFYNILKQSSVFSTVKKESGHQSKVNVSTDEGPSTHKKMKAEKKNRGCSNMEVLERNGPLTRSKSKAQLSRSSSS